MASKTETRRINIYINGKEVENSGKSIRAEFAKARAELNKTNKAAKDYEQKLKSFKDADAALKKHNNELRGVNKSWQQFKSIAAGVLGANLIQGALQRLAGFVTGTIEGNAKLSDSYADVMKTTGLTQAEVAKLSSEFKTFNTRTPRSELLELARDAGKLGIEGSRNVKEFVRQANQINVALGEDLGDDAVLQIGKIADSFGTSMLKIGSTINELGSSTKAQEQFLVDFGSRLQGTANIANISAADILGYGATLDSLGQKVEASGTALNTFFLDFIKDTEKFGAAAGFAEGELSALVGEEGTNAGFIAFIERLKEANPESADFARKLEEVGITGTRSAQTFLALAGNVDQLRANQETANVAFAEGTSLTNEYAIKNNNLAGNLEKVERWLNAMFVNSSIMKGTEKLVGLFSKWVEIPVSETLAKEQMETNKLFLKVTELNVGTKERTELIEQLKQQNPRLLAGIDAETASNEELVAAMDRVNAAYVKKLLMAERQEDIDALVKVQGQKLVLQAEYEDKIRELKVKAMADATLEEKQLLEANFDSIMQRFTDLQNDTSINNRQKRAQQGSMLEQMGFTNISEAEMDAIHTQYLMARRREADVQASTEKIKTQLADIDRMSKQMFGDEPEAAASAVEEGGDLDPAQEANLEKDRLLYEAKQEEFRKAQEEMRAAIAEEQLKLDEQDAAYQLEQDLKEEERKQLEAEEIAMVEQALLSEREREILEAKAHYDELIRLAKKHKIDSTSLEAEKAGEIAAINKHFDDEILAQKQAARMATLQEQMQNIQAVTQFTSQSLSIIGNVMDIIGSSAEGMADFQKGVALFQIGVDMARSIASATAASAANPANAVTAGAAGAGQYIAMVAQITAGIASARQILTQERSPNYTSTGRTNLRSRPVPSFGKGMAGGGGLLKGPKHSSAYGGLHVIDPSTGGLVALFEGDESLLSANTRANNMPIVDALIDSSMNRNGAAIEFPYMNAANQPSVDFASFGKGAQFSKGSSTASADDFEGASSSTADPSMEIMKQMMEVVMELKQNPAPIYTSQLNYENRKIEAAKRLGGWTRTN